MHMQRKKSRTYTWHSLICLKKEKKQRKKEIKNGFIVPKIVQIKARFFIFFLFFGLLLSIPSIVQAKKIYIIIQAKKKEEDAFSACRVSLSLSLPLIYIYIFLL
jgi:hypothetical protein